MPPECSLKRVLVTAHGSILFANDSRCKLLCLENVAQFRELQLLVDMQLVLHVNKLLQ